MGRILSLYFIRRMIKWASIARGASAAIVVVAAPFVSAVTYDFYYAFYEDYQYYKENNSYTDPLEYVAGCHFAGDFDFLNVFFINALSFAGVRSSPYESNGRRRVQPLRNSEHPYAVWPLSRWPFPHSGHCICSSDFTGGWRLRVVLFLFGGTGLIGIGRGAPVVAMAGDGGLLSGIDTAHGIVAQYVQYYFAHLLL